MGKGMKGHHTAMSSRRALRLLPTLVVLLATTTVRPQQPFDLDTAFRAEMETWYVSSIAPLSEGGILLSGRIRFAGDASFRSTAKILDSGQRDPAFPSGVPGGGKLTEWNGRYYVGTNTLVRRIFPTGAWDDDFILMNDGPYFSSLQGGDYHVYPDGRILMSGVHGLSDTVRGFTGLHCLIWFSNQGYLDTTQTHRKCDGAIYHFKQQPDGKFLCTIAGSEYDGQPVGNVIRVHPNGDLDTTFHPYVTWGEVKLFTMLPDGRILASGVLKTEAASTDTLQMVRMFPDGTRDPTFNQSIEVVRGGGYGQFLVLHHTVLPDGRIVIHGNFDHVDGQPRGGIALLDADGHLLDTHFTGAGCGAYDYQGATYKSTRGMVPTPDGSWYIYGAYHGYDDGTTHDPQQRMISRLHGLEVGITPLSTGDGPGVRVYPNPGHDRVRFSGLERGTWQASVFDVRGAMVLQSPVRESQELDVGGLAPGFYTMALLAPDGIRHRLKWVKE
jgi:uncharacterized delta-60 repeat protein